MASSPNGNNPYKGNTKAERVVWMSRTSDVIGSHLKKDMDSYLTLIRRKIQEKCSTTQELINQIRKTKVGDGNFVTPNEFRFTLIKFGLIFPQTLVDKIFAVFDSDRSGTMDFDEFAMWIMNSEFRPVMDNAEQTEYVAPDEQMRRRLEDAIKSNPNVFKYLKREVSYLDIISCITSGQMKNFSERDARYLFQVLDTKKTGFIEVKKIIRWGTTGSILEPPTNDINTMPPINVCLQKICGKNPRNYALLGKCFEKIPKNSALRLGFDEFRSNLLVEGLGRNRKDVEQLFVALGGTFISRPDGDGLTVTGSANIEKLYPHIPVLEDEPISLEKRPVTVDISTSRADRRLRESVRKCYKSLKSELESFDSTNSGYVEPDQLLACINKVCMPLSYEDFRNVLACLNTSEDKKVCYLHFLHLYNPKKSPHVLDGNKTVSDFVYQPHVTNTITSPENMTSPILSRTTSAPMITLKTSGDFVEFENYEKSMKNSWQKVLRECQRNDPDRTGVVTRNTFVNALESYCASSMPTDTIIQLASKYTVPDSGGLIDYISCFRNYLNDMASTMALKTNESAFQQIPQTSTRDLKGQHPWEFGYTREKDSMPYWKLACRKPRLDYAERINNPHRFGNGRSLSATTLLNDGIINEETKKYLLKQYEPRLINICSKCPTLLGPILKDLKNEFKKARHDVKKNEVLTPKFFSVMQSFNIDLSNGEMGAIARAFRAKGMPESVKYEEFLDFCKIVGDNTM